MSKVPEANDRTQARWRSIIKTEEILKRVQACALGFQKMTAIELRASEIILRKVTPDLSTQTLQTELENTLPILKIVPSDSSRAA